MALLFHVPILCLFHRSSGDFEFLTKVIILKLSQGVTKTRHWEPLSVYPRFCVCGDALARDVDCTLRSHAREHVSTLPTIPLRFGEIVCAVDRVRGKVVF